MCDIPTNACNLLIFRLLINLQVNKQIRRYEPHNNKLHRTLLIRQLFIYFPLSPRAINMKPCLISDICYKNFYYKTNPLHHTHTYAFLGVANTSETHTYVSALSLPALCGGGVGSCFVKLSDIYHIKIPSLSSVSITKMVCPTIYLDKLRKKYNFLR